MHYNPDSFNDEMELNFFMNTVTKPHVKKSSDLLPATVHSRMHMGPEGLLWGYK